MAVEPHKKLIDHKKQENIMGNHPCHTQRDSAQPQVSIQKIFLLDKALNPCSERFYDVIFFQIIKLINNSSRQNGKNRAKDNAVNFKIEYKIPETFLLVEEEKGRNIQGKGKQSGYKEPCSEQKAHEL